MKKFSRLTLLLQITLCFASNLQAQTKLTPDIEMQISRVENGLISLHQMPDSVNEMKLADRMAY
ncbi:MAG TPA: hypothetical protein VGD35_20590, partial [Chitinophaga sp.]